MELADVSADTLARTDRGLAWGSPLGNVPCSTLPHFPKSGSPPRRLPSQIGLSPARSDPASPTPPRLSRTPPTQGRWTPQGSDRPLASRPASLAFLPAHTRTRDPSP